MFLPQKGQMWQRQWDARERLYVNWDSIQGMIQCTRVHNLEVRCKKLPRKNSDTFLSEFSDTLSAIFFFFHGVMRKECDLMWKAFLWTPDVCVCAGETANRIVRRVIKRWKKDFRSFILFLYTIAWQCILMHCNDLRDKVNKIYMY